MESQGNLALIFVPPLNVKAELGYSDSSPDGFPDNGNPFTLGGSMVEIIAGSILLCISMFLAIINWKIYTVTVNMLEVTIEIHHKTMDLFKYTKKTYEVLGGEAGLTAPPQRDNILPMQDIYDRYSDIYQKYI